MRQKTTRQPPGPPHFSVISPEEHKEISRRGGIASGEARQEKRKLKEELELLLSSGDAQQRLCTGLIQKATAGDAYAFSVIRDTMGEKAPDKLDVKAMGADLAGFRERHLEAIKRLYLDETDREEPLYGDLARDLLTYEEIRSLLEETLRDVDVSEV